MHHREVMCEGNKGKSSDANLSRRMWAKSLATFKKENKSYTKSENKPLYKIRENSITIVLPILEEKTDLNEDEKQVYNLIKRKTMSSSEILADLDFGKTKTVRIINRLIEKGYIVALGNGRSKKYTAR